jgi:hypothetical protein
MGYPNSQSNPAAATPVWLAPPPGAKSKNITTATNTLVKTGSGVFLGITVNTPHAGATATVYDGTDATGTLLGTFALTTAGGITVAAGGSIFTTGLYVVTAGATPADVTVAYV